MVMARLFGEKCVRCNNQRTKREFEGLPTCDKCEAQIKATRETNRHCPLDGSQMNKEVILNVVIDRCPSCKGIWLDSDELDLVKKGIEAGADGDFATGLVIGMAIG